MQLSNKHVLLWKQGYVLFTAAILAWGLIAPASPGFGQTNDVPWHEPRAEVRFEVTAYLDVPGDASPASVVHVSVCPDTRPAAGLVPVVYRLDGQRCPARVLHAAPGEPTAIAFDAPPPPCQTGTDARQRTQVYVLYLCSSITNPPRPRLAGGLLLESRTSEGPVTEHSIEAFRDRWQAAGRTNGARFVDAIHHAAPVFPPTATVPSEYASYEPSGLILNRYTAFIQVGRDTNAIREAHAKVTRAKKERERILEKAAAARHKLREAEYELGMSVKYPDVIKTSPDVLRERLYSRLRVYDDLTKGELIDINARIRKTTNAIAEIRSGRHTFFAGSRAGSYFRVDGDELIHWPADRSLNLYHGRYVNLAEATTNLPPGRHQIEFEQFGTFDRCMATVAWRPPGAKRARTFTASDAVPAVEGEITAVETCTDRDPPLLFEWRVVGDLRCPSVGDMVQMEFAVLNPRRGSRYEWIFGDGRRGTGETASHLYFRTAMYPVVLTERAATGGRVQRVARREVRAHVLWAKHDLADLAGYEDVFAQAELSGARIAGLLNAYAFARCAATDTVPLDRWRRRVHAALLQRLEDIPAAEAGRLVDVADDAASSASRRYDEARRAYRMVIEKFTGAPAPVRGEAMLGLADLQLNIFGRPRLAQQYLESLSGTAALDPSDRPRYDRLRVHARLASGAVNEARQLARSLARSPDGAGAKQDVALQAGVRRARAVLSNPDATTRDAAEAVAILDHILVKRPEDMLAPELNHLYVRAHLRRKELRRALHLADRLLLLEVPAAYEPLVRADRIRALYGLGREDEARSALEKLAADYPYRSDILEALPATR